MLQIVPFFHNNTATFCYVVFDSLRKDAVIIDPAVDYDEATATISYHFLGEVITYIQSHNLKVLLVVDTHCHADHVTGANYIKNHFGVASVIGDGFSQVQKYFAALYPKSAPNNASSYDQMASNGQILEAGSLKLKAIAVPGHTKSCMAYLIEDALFCGDALFLPYLGCGRCDFPGGSAAELFDSITKNIYSLPSDTRIFVGHDYPKPGENPQCETSVGASKSENIIINERTTKPDFIAAREYKDSNLAPPKLLLIAMQLNILGGQLPQPLSNGRRYLSIPISVQELA